MTPQQIDELFRANEGRADFAPQRGEWEEMSARLDEEDRERGGALWVSVAWLLLFGLLIAGGIVGAIHYAPAAGDASAGETSDDNLGRATTAIPPAVTPELPRARLAPDSASSAIATQAVDARHESEASAGLAPKPATSPPNHVDARKGSTVRPESSAQPSVASSLSPKSTAATLPTSKTRATPKVELPSTPEPSPARVGVNPASANPSPVPKPVVGLAPSAAAAPSSSADTSTGVGEPVSTTQSRDATATTDGPQSAPGTADRAGAEPLKLLPLRAIAPVSLGFWRKPADVPPVPTAALPPRIPRFEFRVLAAAEANAVEMDGPLGVGVVAGLGLQVRVARGWSAGVALQYGRERYVAGPNEIYMSRTLFVDELMPSRTSVRATVLEFPINLTYSPYARREGGRGWFATATLNSHQFLQDRLDLIYPETRSGQPAVLRDADPGGAFASSLRLGGGLSLAPRRLPRLYLGPYVELPLKRTGYCEVSLYTLGLQVQVGL